MLALLTLPGTTSYVKGYYGLEACYIRGLARLFTTENVQLKQLKISIRGETVVKYWDRYYPADKTERTKSLFNQSEIILADFTVQGSRNHLDIPFEIQMPLHEPLTFGFGPCSQYLPNSVEISGSETYKDYSAHTRYYVKATLIKQSSIPLLTFSEEVEVEFPLTVYDNRLLVGLLYPEQRIWKSHIGATPVEYDMSVSSSVVGPGDYITFKYRILVDPVWAAIGIRVRQVTLGIKEICTVGEDRCCALDDREFIFGHTGPRRIRQINDVMRESTSEYPNINKKRMNARPYGNNPKRSDNYDGLAIPDRKYIGNDGIYVEREVLVQIPEISRIHPTSSRNLLRPDDYLCYGKRPRDAYISIRHIYRATIEMYNCDNITVDAGLYVSAVNRQECERVYQEERDILPCVDYEKHIGLVEWVPEYALNPKTDQASHEYVLVDRSKGKEPMYQEYQPPQYEERKLMLLDEETCSRPKEPIESLVTEAMEDSII